MIIFVFFICSDAAYDFFVCGHPEVEADNIITEVIMKKSLTKILCLLLVSFLVLSFAACGPSDDGKDGSSSGGHVTELRIGTTTANDTFNILSQGGIFGRINYVGFVHGNWVYIDEDRNIQPYFMTSFNISDDGKVLDFTFPTDAVWGDGEPVTGADILFSFDFMKNTAKSNYLKNLVSWELTGENSARITFSEPDAYQFLLRGAMTVGCIPEHIWKEMVGNPDYGSWTDDRAAIGCGPYKLVSKDTDAGVSVYEAIPQNNYAGEITVDKVIIKTYADQTAILMALQNNEIDCYYAYSLPIDATLIDMVASDENINIGESYYAGQNQITFGMTRDAYSDYAMRDATLKCFDWELLANVQGGQYAEIPTTNLLAPPCLGFVSTYPKFKQDIAEANRILDEAGYIDKNGDGYREFPDGSELDILVVPQYSRDMTLRNRLAEVMMDNLKTIGIKSHIDPEMIANSEIWESNILDGKYDIAIGYTTSGMALGTSTAFRYYVYEPEPGTSRESSWLWGTCQDPEFNSEVWKMIASSSQEEFVQHIQRLQQIFSDQLIGASLGWTKSFFPYRTDAIQGWDNFPSWGVINNKTWTTLTTK